LYFGGHDGSLRDDLPAVVCATQFQSMPGKRAYLVPCQTKRPADRCVWGWISGEDGSVQLQCSMFLGSQDGRGDAVPDLQCTAVRVY
jgi:hypothetical protein